MRPAFSVNISMDMQLLFNIAIGILSTLAGWFFKVMYDQIRDIESEVNVMHHRFDRLEAKIDDMNNGK